VALYEGTASLAGMIGATFAILRSRASELTCNVFLAAGTVLVILIVGTLAHEVPTGSDFLLGFAIALGCIAALCAICASLDGPEASRR